MADSAFVDLRSSRALTLGSGCKIVFIKKQNGQIVPALMLIGIEGSGKKIQDICGSRAQGKVGIITSEIVRQNNTTTLKTHFKNDYVIDINPISSESSQGSDQNTDWMFLDAQQDKIVYPRIFIHSLNIKTDSNSLILKYENFNDINESQNNTYTVLKPYEDYSILTRSLQDEYVLTIDNNVIIKKGVPLNSNGGIINRKVIVNYTISNADTAIYLDALQISKENAQPKVSYEVKPNIFNSKAYSTIYDRLGNIVRINDTDLKFKNVRGYISGLTLDLDFPENDVVEIKNYKSKFEDLFSTISAQTQQMKKNNHLIEMATSAFTSTGDISSQVLQSSIFKVDLNYAFDNGKLTIDELNGIWGASDNGVVAFRGGGIFTSTERDIDGNWKWNTGITPEGINANLITSGQLDTNLIKIYAGDHLRFQMNGDGIFAYKSWINDVQEDESQNRSHPIGQGQVQAALSLDGKQYVRFNEDGLVLVARKGARVLNSQKTDYIEVLSDEVTQQNPNLLSLDEIKRVEVSWDGFILRNWQNERVFYADPETGNLTLKGRIEADQGRIGIWFFNHTTIWAPASVNNGIYTQFVALNAGGTDGEDSFLDANGQPIYEYNTSGQVIYINGEPKKKLVGTKDYAFWAGNIDPIQATFSIKKSGEMFAASGKIGGWSIQSDDLHSDKVYLSTTVKVSDSILVPELGSKKYTTINGESYVTGYNISKINRSINGIIWGYSQPSQTNINWASFIIQDKGYMYANEFYLINRDSAKKIISVRSVSAEISDAVEAAAGAASMARTASGAASTASSKADDALSQISKLRERVTALESKN